MFNIHKRRFMYKPTVKNLIEYLQRMPQDANVIICGDDYVYLNVDETFENDDSCSTTICIDTEDLEECYEDQFKVCYNLINCANPTWIVMYHIGSETYSSYVIAHTMESAIDIIVRRYDIDRTDVFRVLDAQYATILIDNVTLKMLKSDDDPEVKDFLNRFCFTTDPVISTTHIQNALGGNELPA